MVASPVHDAELVFFGGERFTGDRANFYSDLFVLNVDKNTWTRYDSPTRPPPRSSHAVAVHRNFMYLFGGEYSNPSLSQYRHYRDLWRLDMETMEWEKIDGLRGGPSARSGHRMCIVEHKLVVFGGFFDTGYENKYLNDMYFIDLTQDELAWTKVETSAVDVVPSPRSGFQWVVCGGEVVLYGGYYKQPAAKAKSLSHKGKKKGDSAMEEAMAAQGVVLSDSYKLSGSTLKWQKVKRMGYGPSRRAGFSLVLHKRNIVLFGGVEDDETEEDLESVFYNDMFAMAIDRKFKWFPMTLRKKKGKKGGGRRRRKPKPEDASASMDVEPVAEVEEDIINVDGAVAEEEEDEGAELDTEALEAALLLEQKEEEEVLPCGRFHACTAVQRNVMYIAGGLIEKGDQEITLDDIWSVDLNKLDEFQIVKEMSAECAEWIASDSESEDGNSDDEEWEEADEDEEMDSDDAAGEQIRRRGRVKRLRDRVVQPEGDSFTPMVNETLKEFFERTRPYWIGEVHEALGEGGKTLRRVAFEWAFKRYWEIKPTLKELEELEAELAREEELEKQFAKAEVDGRRGRSRR